MTEQVLIIDPNNFKALVRRANAYLELGEIAKAKDTLSEAKKLAISKEDKKLVSDLNVYYEKKFKGEKEFAKKVFEKSKQSKTHTLNKYSYWDI